MTFISVILFIDALLLIGKDHELQKLKNFTVSFPLTKKNVEEYIQKFGEHYSAWNVKLKPDTEFMPDIIRNLFICFPYKTKKEIDFIRAMCNIITEIYSQYRIRTAFVAVSPILFVVSILALLSNYIYFEIDGVNEIISIGKINKIAMTTLLVLGIFVVLFPSRIMNLLLLKKM